MSEDAEIWKALKDERKERKHKRSAFNQELIECLGGEHEFEIEMVTPYQMRLSLPKGKLDFFPQSHKATWVGSGKWFKIQDIETFLNDQFK